MRYTRAVTANEMAALVRDALTTKDLVLEEDAELMKLEPLVEEPAEDGTRRFHIGDVLSAFTGRILSPRGVSGLYDILGYMTDDRPAITQLDRFVEECKPYLERQGGSVLNPHLIALESVKDNLSLYKWLSPITEEMGGVPFLKIDKLDREVRPLG